MIDVIIPVYKGLEETRRCLASVLAGGSRAAFETVVVDDASPDPQTARYLDELAHAGRITLLRNDRNLGFVGSVNRGMALHRDRDVVLLNSDTEVDNDWLDRLERCVHSQPDIGTGTPFSNNATICSYPFDGWAGGVPGKLGLTALDRLFADVNATKRVDLPTGVGSCLYIRRACLDKVGEFNAEQFGRGYGEENDFCLRAAAAGWRSVLAADVFVFHEGAVSFSAERAERTQAAGKIMLKLHPDYPQRVQAFVAADPARPLREAIDTARLAHGPDEAACVLTERVQELTRLAYREAHAGERHSIITELRAALAHAEGLVAEQEPEKARLRAEIDQLRAGLSHAETLAIERLQEIKYLHESWLWKVLSPWLRRR
jgi:O-antigen biosynthesis protein